MRARADMASRFGVGSRRCGIALQIKVDSIFHNKFQIVFIILLLPSRIAIRRGEMAGRDVNMFGGAKSK